MKAETAFNMGVICGRLVRTANTISDFDEKRADILRVVEDIEKIMFRETEVKNERRNG